MLVVVNDLPAAATTVPLPESTIEGQTLRVAVEPATEAAVAELTDETALYEVVRFDAVQWPVDPSTTMTSGFGKRSAPCAGCSTQHSGVDWTPGYGAPVYAIADGVVVSRQKSDWGSYVVIEHTIKGETIESGYAHLVRGTNLPVGTVVKRGDVVGLSGNTGRTSGAHLHFTISKGGTHINPLTWMRKHVTEAWGS